MCILKVGRDIYGIDHFVYNLLSAEVLIRYIEVVCLDRVAKECSLVCGSKRVQ